MMVYWAEIKKEPIHITTPQSIVQNFLMRLQQPRYGQIAEIVFDWLHANLEHNEWCTKRSDCNTYLIKFYNYDDMIKCKLCLPEYVHEYEWKPNDVF